MLDLSNQQRLFNFYKIQRIQSDLKDFIQQTLSLLYLLTIFDTQIQKYEMKT